MCYSEQPRIPRWFVSSHRQTGGIPVRATISTRHKVRPHFVCSLRAVVASDSATADNDSDTLIARGSVGRLCVARRPSPPRLTVGTKIYVSKLRYRMDLH